MTRPYDYVAYIDEAGDPGVRAVKPIDPKGSSEWLILSAVVIRADNEGAVLGWAKDAIADLGITQRRDLHFHTLSPSRKRRLTTLMGSYRARYFVVASNKKNMRGYSNPFAAEKAVDMVGNPFQTNNWFYYWVSRLLLERVSDFVWRRSIAEFGEARKVRLEFSQNRGLRYDELRAYLSWLRMHDISGTQFLKKGPIRWDVIDLNQMYDFQHKTRAGLQFADAVASSFFAACDTCDTGGVCTPEYAKLLEVPIARNAMLRRADYGVKLMPHPAKALLTREQADIFRFYGYRF